MSKSKKDTVESVDAKAIAMARFLRRKQSQMNRRLLEATRMTDRNGENTFRGSQWGFSR